MKDFFFSSVLSPDRKEELAELMFFNLRQHKVRDDIVHAIELYGAPEIVSTEHSLRFTVGDLGEVQTLYAFENDVDGRLVGVMVYARVSVEKVVLLHMGVAGEFASDGLGAQELLALRMIYRLKRIALALKGVRQVEVLYGRRATTIRF